MKKDVVCMLKNGLKHVAETTGLGQNGERKKKQIEEGSNILFKKKKI